MMTEKEDIKALRENDVAYVDRRFREIAEYLERLNVPGTVWLIKTGKNTYQFVAKRKKT